MDREVLPARALGVLFLAGASLGLLSLVLPHPVERDALLAVLIVTAYLLGAGMVLSAGRLPRWWIHAGMATGATMVALAIYASGVAGGAFGSMFFWLALLAGLFLPFTQAMAHLAWILTLNAIVLTQVANPTGISRVTQWLLFGIALGVVTGVTNWIAADRNRLDDERQRLLAEVEALALTDSLTGLPNRRAWEEVLARELERARRDGTRPCVALVDVDHLKEFNDKYGHRVGDTVLREAAQSWRDVLRGSDYVARYGGDEFAVLLPDCSLDEARVVIERLREAAPSGQSYSAGLAAWDGTGTGSDLVDRADAALYTAKAAGRGRLSATASAERLGVPAWLA